MSEHNNITTKKAREKFLGLSLESTRKSYYPQLQKQLEAAKENERKQQLLIDNLPAGIVYIDRDQRFVLANQQYTKIYETETDLLTGKHIRELKGNLKHSLRQKDIDTIFQGKQIQYEVKILNSDGQEQVLNINYVPDIDIHGQVNGFYGLVIDITEKTNLESKLRDVQRIESIGTLAGGIAHDFNNLLMAIQGRTSLMAVELEHSDAFQDHINAIEGYINSATHLTNQLLGFARGGKYEVTPLDINSLVLESSTLFGRTKKELHIHKHLSGTPLIVEADKTQIEQVLLNMYLNAWQAMPDGGDLVLQTGIVEMDQLLCNAHTLDPGQYGRVIITDTGVGIPQENCKRVFDPFFTTKEQQRGTGLGLASAYGIVKNHGGIITLQSKINQGTTFTIYLPLSAKDVTQATMKEDDIVFGTETILLVDDENIILDVAQAMLETLGYTVLTAQSGSEALHILSQSVPQVDLVILDLIMPDMDGAKTFDLIVEMNPAIPVILSSGYSMNNQVTQILNKGCKGFIQKPFTIAELSASLQKVLIAF